MATFDEWPTKNTPYDSTEDTIEHIQTVRRFMKPVIDDLRERARTHDASKLEDPEKSGFDKYTPLLQDMTYGSDEYFYCIDKLRESALDHHYANNSHHPEHYEVGIEGMDLLDLVEMMADWRAATERHDDGDIRRSLKINKKRFNIGDQLQSILENTVDRYFDS